MCRISENTILRANERMALYKVGNTAETTNEIVVSTKVMGRTYKSHLTMEQVNDAFGNALRGVQQVYGKAV